MKFANPAWLWALLLLIPLFALRIFSHSSKKRNLTGLVAPRLHALLVSGSSQARAWFTFGFLMMAMVSLIVALARPQLGSEEIESYSEGRSLIIAIDTSRSMLATDLVPNRLERAKLAARDIVDSLPEDRIGLIAFAGRAFMQAPLTNDHQAVIESIEQIDTEVIPRGGTNLTSAASLALSSFREAESDQNALIIFSDGEALEGQEQVEAIKKEADRESMIIITIGVGTEKGSIIPEPGQDGRPQEGVFVKDSQGQVVRSRLDASALQKLATGGGVFIQLGDRASLTRVVKTITKSLTVTREEEAPERRPIERFMWPLSAAFLFLLLAHLVHFFFLLPNRPRKRLPPPLPGKKATPPALPVLMAALFLFGNPVLARDSKDAWNDLKEDEFEAAIEKFEAALEIEDISERERTAIQLGIGSAAYKLGDFERASKAYGEALIRPDKRTREQAHYNLGNTLFRQGETVLAPPPSADPSTPVEMAPDPEKTAAALRQWHGALEHFQAALKINKKNSDARHNIEVVKDRIEKLQEQTEQEPPPQEQEKPEDQKQEQEQEEEEQDDQKEEEQSGDQEQKNEDHDGGQDKNDDGQSDEKQEEGEKDQNEEQDDQQDPNSGENNDQKNENEKENQPENGESDQEKNAQNEPGNGEEPQQPPDPGDGKLSANESSPPPGKEDQSGKPAREKQVNPETGYSPSEARQLIEALADENGELRPIYPRPFRAEKYKNW